MSMLIPPAVPTPYRSDGEFYAFVEYVETPVPDGIQAHQDVVNQILLDMKLHPDRSYYVNAFQFTTYDRKPPMQEQYFITQIHYSAIADVGDGPDISGV